MLIDCGYESGFSRSFGVRNVRYKRISRSATRKIPSFLPRARSRCWLSLLLLALENRPCLSHYPPARSILAVRTSPLNNSSSTFCNNRRFSSSNSNSSNLPPRRSSHLMDWRSHLRRPPILISPPLPQHCPSQGLRRPRHPPKPSPKPLLTPLPDLLLKQSYPPHLLL